MSIDKKKVSQDDLENVAGGKVTPGTRTPTMVGKMATGFSQVPYAEGPAEATTKKCPKCYKPMQLVDGPAGKKWICPDCAYTIPTGTSTVI